MITIEYTLSVNNGDEPDLPALSRDDVWNGLVMKAENAVPFVAAVTRCDILERSENSLVREVDLRGEPVREKVTFEPHARVIYQRLTGPADGTTVNEIIEPVTGKILLRFAFDMKVKGVADGSAEEEALAGDLANAYRDAIETTISWVREFKRGHRIENGA